MSVAQRRIRRYALLPHQQSQWTTVVGALKHARLYDRMVGIERREGESLKAFTARFARGGVGCAERSLMVPTNSCLYERGGAVDAVALPRSCVAIVFPLTGPVRVVGGRVGVCEVSSVLRVAGIQHVL
jgi:hypothetical protein